MSIEREAEVLAARLRESRTARAVHAIKLRLYRRRVAAYRACFLGDDGQLSQAGALVLADIGRIAGVGVARPQRSSEQVQFDEGQRRIVLHVLAMMHLDADKLARMAGRIRGESDE